MQIPSVSLFFRKRQPAAASITECGHFLANVHIESSSNVERSLLRGKRDRDFGSVCHYLNMTKKELILSERKNPHEHLGKEAGRALQGESTAQKR